MSDLILNEIMAVQMDGTTEDGKQKTDLPVYPGENPTKSELMTWCDAWSDHLTATGYSAALRGAMPYEHVKLKPRARIPVPADAETARKAAIESKNQEIDHDNSIKKEELESRELEIQSRLFGKLSKSMRSTAPIKLKNLQAEFAIKDSEGANVPGAFDAIKIFLSLQKESKTSDMNHYSTKMYEDAYDRLKKTKLPDNCSPNTFSHRLNTFMTKVNPFMERPLEGELLSRFILAQLPSALASDGRTLHREIIRRKVMNEPSTVLAEALVLIEESYDPVKKMATPVNSLAAGGILAESGITDGSTQSVLQKMVNSAVKGAIANPNGGGRGAAGKGSRDAGRGGRGGRGRGADGGAARSSRYRLPEGTFCKEGTCNFDHDTLKPDERCYRAPDFEGPVPLATWNNVEQRDRINADKKANSIKLNKPFKPLVAPAGAAAMAVLPPASSGAGEDILVDLFGFAPVKMLDTAKPLLGDSLECESADSDDFGGYEVSNDAGAADPLSPQPKMVTRDLELDAAEAEALLAMASHSPPTHITIEFDTPGRDTGRDTPVYEFGDADDGAGVGIPQDVGADGVVTRRSALSQEGRESPPSQAAPQQGAGEWKPHVQLGVDGESTGQRSTGQLSTGQLYQGGPVTWEFEGETRHVEAPPSDQDVYVPPGLSGRVSVEPGSEVARQSLPPAHPVGAGGRESPTQATVARGAPRAPDGPGATSHSRPHNRAPSTRYRIRLCRLWTTRRRQPWNSSVASFSQA